MGKFKELDITMGYRSDIIIVVSKKVYMEAFLLGTFPESLKENWVEKSKDNNAFYFRVEGYKWYDDYPEVREVMDFLGNLEPATITYTGHDGKQSTYEQDQYGFIRIGEEDYDVEILGDPSHFEVYVERTISSPNTTAI